MGIENKGGYIPPEEDVSQKSEQETEGKKPRIIIKGEGKRNEPRIVIKETENKPRIEIKGENESK